jgi:hypothetical protein
MKKDYDCIHATIDLKVKYLDETTIDKYKARVCGCGNELVQSATYTNETSLLSHNSSLDA